MIFCQLKLRIATGTQSVIKWNVSFFMHVFPLSLIASFSPLTRRNFIVSITVSCIHLDAEDPTGSSNSILDSWGKVTSVKTFPWSMIVKNKIHTRLNDYFASWFIIWIINRGTKQNQAQNTLNLNLKGVSNFVQTAMLSWNPYTIFRVNVILSTFCISILNPTS